MLYLAYKMLHQVRGCITGNSNYSTIKKSIILIISCLFLKCVFAQNEDHSILKDTLDFNELKYAEYPGGVQALILYIEENTKYPKSLKQKKMKEK